MFKLIIIFSLLIFVGCNGNRNTTTDNLPYNKNDTDNDGLADKYEKEFHLTVGIKDADNKNLDPLLTYQWHLINNTLQKGEDINISPVWRDTIGEKNISVAIVDTGVDIKHDDIVLDVNKSYRYSDGGDDPSPTAAQLYNNNEGSAHGTACAGLVAATGWNGIGVRGVAPGVSVVGLNVFSKPDDSSFSDALQRDGIDVSSNSWGGGGANWLFDDSVSLAAIENGIKNGRETKGVSYVFAAGNDAANANFQSILTSGYVIAVSAVDDGGKLENYSDFGANILVNAPGGAADINQHLGIVTTDLTGLNNGMDVYRSHWNVFQNSDGNYTNAMNGTSAACPMVSGVVALMLSVNKNLTYRDVQYILATTARKNDLNDLSWKKNGAGYGVSDKYGFGMINAGSAVERAKNFISLGNELTFTKTKELNVSIDTANEALFQTDVNVDFSITKVQLKINTNHNNNGKLKIVLESPSGTLSTLAYGDIVLYDKYEPWTFLSTQFLDENSKGRWILHIQDMGSGNKGELKQWSLTIKGYKR